MDRVWPLHSATRASQNRRFSIPPTPKNSMLVNKNGCESAQFSSRQSGRERRIRLHRNRRQNRALREHVSPTLNWGGAGGRQVHAAKTHVQRCQVSVQERRKLYNYPVVLCNTCLQNSFLWRSSRGSVQDRGGNLANVQWCHAWASGSTTAGIYKLCNARGNRYCCRQPRCRMGAAAASAGRSGRQQSL